ncbi:MAG: DUF2817 domain-containing protein [Opitutales bacterium]|nr:DUF2817 domain-containing protein [Opitutales bacterium]
MSAITPQLSVGFTTQNNTIALRKRTLEGPGAKAVDRRVLDTFEANGFRFEIDKYICLGPRENDVERKVLGIFGGIHGNERAGTLICEAILLRFTADPSLLNGYELHIYPACNPWGLLFNSRNNANGTDLNRSFWTGSTEGETRILEAELRKQRLDGLISLHTDHKSDGLYGYTQGRQIGRHLLEPALEEASRILPLNGNSTPDGFHAAEGMIEECLPEVLRPPPALRGWPFEIILQTPGTAPMSAQVSAGSTAVIAILKQYRRFLAHSWGI